MAHLRVVRTRRRARRDARSLIPAQEIQLHAFAPFSRSAEGMTAARAGAQPEFARAPIDHQSKPILAVRSAKIATRR